MAEMCVRCEVYRHCRVLRPSFKKNGRRQPSINPPPLGAALSARWLPSTSGKGF
ncbi:hypothetical protein LE23_21 [Eggerthella phage LE2-3]|nr:hypothetical protein LE23_21 [Eggerthella phage LE2-3]